MLVPKVPFLVQIRLSSYKKLRSWYSGLVKAKPQEAPFNHVVQIGDPTLRTVAEAVPLEIIKSPEIQFLRNKMKSVFKKYNCVGLSAPQIGINVRLIMFEFNEKHARCFSVQERENKEISVVPFTTVINPEIKIIDYTKIVFTESCESVKGFYADVPRYKSLHLKGYDEDGNLLDINASGWFARIIQHEVDHLDGKIYTDIMDRKTLACSCWQVINDRGGKVELPYGA